MSRVLLSCNLKWFSCKEALLVFISISSISCHFQFVVGVEHEMWLFTKRLISCLFWKWLALHWVVPSCSHHKCHNELFFFLIKNEERVKAKELVDSQWHITHQSCCDIVDLHLCKVTEMNQTLCVNSPGWWWCNDVGHVFFFFSLAHLNPLKPVSRGLNSTAFDRVHYNTATSCHLLVAACRVTTHHVTKHKSPTGFLSSVSFRGLLSYKIWSQHDTSGICYTARDWQHKCAADKHAKSDAMSTLTRVSEECFQQLVESKPQRTEAVSRPRFVDVSEVLVYKVSRRAAAIFSCETLSLVIKRKGCVCRYVRPHTRTVCL